MKGLIFTVSVLLLMPWLASAQGNYFSDTLHLSLEDAFPSPMVRELAFQASIGNTVAIDGLLNTGSLVNSTGRHSLTPLAWAVGSRNRVGAESLLARGADPDILVEGVGSLLAVAVGLKDKSMFSLLIQYRASPYQGSPMYRSALLRAVISGDSFFLEQLLLSGADPNHYGDVNNPLDTVTRIQDFQKAAMLLRSGADPNLTPRLAAWIAASLNEAEATFRNDRDYRVTVELALAKGLQMDLSQQK